MNRKIIITGIIGILASSLMYIGDMLLYFTTTPIHNFEEEIIGVMANISSTRLIISGLIGPASAVLYIIGFYHIYLLIKADNTKIAKFIFVLLFFGMSYGGAFHSHFPILGLISRFDNLSISGVVEEYTILHFYFMFFPSLLAYFLLGYLILTKKTFYPRWFVLFSPIVLFWFSGLVRKLPQPLMIIIAGGWSNMIFIIFFTISTILSYRNNYGEV